MTATAAHDPSPVHETTVPAIPVTLALAFQASVARVPDRVALRTPGGDAPLTWAQYGAAVERLAGALAGLGVRRGDRVAVWSHNRPELAITAVAAAHAELDLEGEGEVPPSRCPCRCGSRLPPGHALGARRLREAMTRAERATGDTPRAAPE
jgi:non-ribosomal peptide synthetase component F